MLANYFLPSSSSSYDSDSGLFPKLESMMFPSESNWRSSPVEYFSSELFSSELSSTSGCSIARTNIFLSIWNHHRPRTPLQQGLFLSTRQNSHLFCLFFLFFLFFLPLRCFCAELTSRPVEPYTATLHIVILPRRTTFLII
jgi:hypothetical protein